MIDVKALFETGVTVAPVTVAPDFSTLLPFARAGVGHIIEAPPRHLEVTGAYRRVVIVRVIPSAIPDPEIPLALCAMSEGHWWAMRHFWRALLRMIGGWPFAAGNARRWARVVLTSLDPLEDDEREFFERYLWAAFNGEAR